MRHQTARRRTHRGMRPLLSALASLLVLAACSAASGSPASNSPTTFGDRVTVGKGSVRTYVTAVDGVPSEVGVALSEAALEGLPSHHSPGGVEIEPGHMTFEHVLALPENNPTPFRHVVVNWNPGGHEPPGIYDTPHFDFHFYTINSEERRAIDPADPQFKVKAERIPGPEQIPAGYVLPAPVGIPQMGVHWVDPTSPELNGKPFSTTFIYGSWNGQVIFAEPMITRAFLQSKPNFTAELPAAQVYEGGGYHPTGYRVQWDEATREWRIALTGLVQR